MTVHSVGVDYCLVHCGIRNEDDSVCDFAYDDEEDTEVECDLRPLVWIEET